MSEKREEGKRKKKKERRKREIRVALSEMY